MDMSDPPSLPAPDPPPRIPQIDALPHIVNEQWAPPGAHCCGVSPLLTATNAAPLLARHPSTCLPESERLSVQEQAAQYLGKLCPQRQTSSPPGGPFCAVFLVDEGVFCRRINTLQSFLEVNRELASTDASGTHHSCARLVSSPLRSPVCLDCLVGMRANK
jgi:hypothetical protein